MLLTFILPHYNLPGELLQRCIASIVAQDIPVGDYEVIVVDDGSDTPPEWVVEQFAQANVRLVKAAHGGPGAARNIGLDEAKGEYVQFVDADDSLVPDSFRACVQMLRNEAPDILQHGYRVCRTAEQMKQSALWLAKNRVYSCGAEYVAHNNLSGCPWMYIFRRSIALCNDVRFAENVMHEDEDFNLKIYYYGEKLVVCSNVVYNYFQRPDSITVNNDILHNARRINALFKLLERVVEFRYSQQEVCSLVQRAALNRKIAMLTVDTMLNLFYDGWNAKEVDDTCREFLRPYGLYPFPMRNYSLKYLAFAMLANSFKGLEILRRILPSQKPQNR